MHLALDRPQDVARFREVLDRAGYTAEHVRAALGHEGATRVRRTDVPVHRRRLTGATELETLLRIFWLGDDVERKEAARALRPLTPEALAALGLLETSAGGVRGSVRLVPFDPLVLACDRDDVESADYVAGMHQPSVTLANLTVRRKVASAADVGAGFGVQALLAAAHSDRVVATDVNPRALGFLAFSAQLNAIGNIECRQGNLLEPLGKERFDLLTCNPPYVVSPDAVYLYRDSGLVGDAVSREVVRRSPSALAEGGFAHLLVSWIRKPGDEWRAPLDEWLEGCGCDAWVLHSGSEDPLAAAATWNSPLQAEDPAEFERTLDRWLDYYERLGAERVAYGAMILRRREGGQNWIRCDDVLGSPIGPSSDLVLRVFENQDFLEGLTGDEALLGHAFRLVERHRFEQVVRLREGAWEVDATMLILEDGLEFRGPVDALVLDVLAGCDGQRPLGDLVEDAEARAELVPVVRRLLELGILARG